MPETMAEVAPLPAESTTHLNRHESYDYREYRKQLHWWLLNFGKDPTRGEGYAEALDGALDSVRLDTTSSRRGDFRHIVREVRWELDARGYEDVGIFASGGITPPKIRSLRDVVDGFGVGGYISNADPIDFALDIVEVEGEPAAKRGKLSGVKQVYRTDDDGHHVGLAQNAGPVDGEALLEPLVRDGDVVRDFDLEAASERAAREADTTGFDP